MNYTFIQTTNSLCFSSLQNFFNDGPAWKDVMSQSGLDDMTLLSKLTNEQIMQNLKERFDNGIIYVCFFSFLFYVRLFLINKHVPNFRQTLEKY